jgi:hypothetical protein
MMITPSSSLVDNTISRTGFEYRHNCQVLGIQHHAHMIRSRMGQAKLAAGDLLLVKCDTETLRGLREDLDVVLVEFSVEELPNLKSGQCFYFHFSFGGSISGIWFGANRDFVFFWRLGDGGYQCHQLATGNPRPRF